MKKCEILILLLILLVAAGFRFAHFGSIPPGLYPDEAINGNNALQAIETGSPTGGYKVFYPENNGREGLFVNIQAQFLRFLPNEPWVLRLPSAIFGILTVLGLYLLTRRLFNWQIAALSSFLLAISFWHVNFSRIGFRAITAPFFAVWGFYFFWRGKGEGKLIDFATSGIFWGLGLYTYLSFRVLPLSLAIILLVYWQTIKKHFFFEKYSHIRNQMVRGFAMFLVAMIIIALPIGIYFYNNHGDFWGRSGQLSIFSTPSPVKTFFIDTAKTFGMFNFAGDWNWRHNLSGQPLLIWPVGALFVLGFLRSWYKLFRLKKRHGHCSTSQTLLLSWFFVGLIPVILSNEGIPHSLRALIVVPPVFIFAGEGLWWIMDKIGDWYRERDVHEFRIQDKWIKESSVVSVIVVVILLAAFGIVEYDKYFNKWAKNPETAMAFNQNYVDIGHRLNNMPRDLKKYVLVNASGVLVNGIPMPSQTVMFITDTYTPEKQEAKNIYYLTEEQYQEGLYDQDSVVIRLE